MYDIYEICDNPVVKKYLKSYPNTICCIIYQEEYDKVSVVSLFLYLPFYHI